MLVQRLIKHNPLFMSDDELESTFVVRQAELQILADLVRGNKGEVNQHALVIGSRGMGKTMLLRRLALLVRSDEALKDAWYPIVAPEEIYDAKTEGEIWLAILRSLADQQRGDNGQFERWLERYEALLGEHEEERLRAGTLGALTEFSHERGKRLLVLIENLQMLLGEQFAHDADWDLRRTLLNRPEIMLVLTATTRFEKIDQPAFAAYELFRELELKPLSTDGCRRLWCAISGQDLADLRIRPMEILTGGNPRLLAILATFAPEHPLQELMANLAELIDAHTPFLKSNIDALPPQERRVFVNLAKLWEPSSARHVGHRSRINSNTTSAVLRSLMNRGIVVECGSAGRGKLYQVAERIYCIYHLMRFSGSEADRMRAFVRFMVPLYGADNLACSLAEAACASNTQSRIGFVEGYRELLRPDAPQEVRQRILKATPRAFLDLPEARSSLSMPLNADQLEAERLADEASALEESGHAEEAVVVWDKLVSRFPCTQDPVVLGHVARALFNRGVALQSLHRHEEAVAVYDTMVHRFSIEEDPVLAEAVARALVNKGAALGVLGRREDQVEACDEVVRRFAAADDITLREAVAKSLVNKGIALYALGRLNEALAVWNDTVRGLSTTDDPALLRQFTEALYNSGVALEDLGQQEGALSAYDELERRIATSNDTVFLVLLAKALVNKGNALINLGRSDEALGAYDDVVRRFSATQDTDLLFAVSKALLHKGYVLHDLGRLSEAMRAFADVVRHFSDAQDHRLLNSVGEALNGSAWLYYVAGFGRLEDAIAAGINAIEVVPHMECRHTLASVYALAGRWDEAFEQLDIFAQDDAFVQRHPDHMLAIIIDAAADGQAWRALRAISGTLVERSMEPLVLALKELAGEESRAPREIEEVKGDVLLTIELTRRELAAQRARLAEINSATEAFPPPPPATPPAGW